MEEYEIDCTIVVMAESNIDALDKIKAMFDGIAQVSLTSDMNNELFQELGVSYD